MKEDTKPVEDEQGVVEDDSTPGKSLTRKAALGVGAVALGGAALGGLANAGGAQAATNAIVPDGAVFKQVLTKLATSASFRQQALTSPGVITKTYPSLTKLQLEALRDCAILSGVNIASINKVRAAAISSSTAASMTISIGGHSTGWSISCCSCCCCCCGETAVLVRP